MNKSVLNELVAAGAVRGLVAQTTSGGYHLVVLLDNGQRTLATQRGHLRVFRSLDAVSSFVGNVGAKEFSVTMAHPPMSDATRR